MADDRPSQKSRAQSSHSSVISVEPASSASGVNLPSDNWQQQQQGSSQASGTIRRPHQGPQSIYGDYGTTNPPTCSLASPPEHFPSNTLKRSTLTRRMLSVQGLHKGQGFSVDDAQDEVQKDLEEQQMQQARSTSIAKRSHPSLRRRATAPLRTIRRVGSAEEFGPGIREEAEETESTEGGKSPLMEASGHLTSLFAPRAQEDATDNDESRGDSDEAGDDGENGDDEDEDDDDDDDDDVSDSESFTLKDRQEAINETHPFGIRIWKPALYKKRRSVERTAEGDLHSAPGVSVGSLLKIVNIMWSLAFGWWLAILVAVGALLFTLLGFIPSCRDYGRILWGLSGYFLDPFGRFVLLTQDEAYHDEDSGEGRSMREYEQWQSGDIEEGRLFFGPKKAQRSIVGRRRDSIDTNNETDSLLGRPTRRRTQGESSLKTKPRLFGRGQWTVGRVLFFAFFYGLLTPCMLIVAGLCWFLIFPIPMARVLRMLFQHLRKHPLALSFHSASAGTRGPDGVRSTVIVCTYRAAGFKYWKYTIDGTNIILINLLAIVAFVIVDYYVFSAWLGWQILITNQLFVFVMALCSITPLAYFIGQAVASISAQSSMGVGATINAFFSTLVEVFLYCVALKEGKAALVEGSVIGSIFAGILLLPGISMCCGALKRKTQRFNVKSAGVTSTMLLFAVIGAFGPTLFYQIYGSHELNCYDCSDFESKFHDRGCRRCYFAQSPFVQDRFYSDAVRPYIYFAAVMLFLSYVIGLVFTLRTHAALIWATDTDEKRLEKSEYSLPHAHANANHPVGQDLLTDGTIRPNSRQGGTGDAREMQVSRRLLGESLKQAERQADKAAQRKPEANLGGRSADNDGGASDSTAGKSFLAPTLRPTMGTTNTSGAGGPSGLEDERQARVGQVAETAAAAVTIAAREVSALVTGGGSGGGGGGGGGGSTRLLRRNTTNVHGSAVGAGSKTGTLQRNATFVHGQSNAEETAGPAGAGSGVGAAAGGHHDAPNWSRTKSVVVLLVATLAYAVIAEILVNTVDSILENVDIDEKFVGITLFALVPNTTEFLNAISFAMNGNIALSMEIGSAYALQVCLLQIPALVLFSAVYLYMFQPEDAIRHSFTLIFPQWDMVTVILCVFLLSYMYGEGKSNYFKGSILILSYLVVMVGFYFAGFDNGHPTSGGKYDGATAVTSYRTVGRSRSGVAFAPPS